MTLTLETGIAGVILASLVVYALLAGADFGGGVWDLFAFGPRASRQRKVVAGAIGPIWEANHVWMIIAVVLLFTAFPTAFSVIMTALHIPVTLMLIGIVLRGSSFVFRKTAPQGEGVSSTWQVVFAVSSLITPVMLGVILGAVSTPGIAYRDGVVTGGFVRPWLTPFPWAVGLFALVLFAFLAAVYLTMETRDAELRLDFRARALVSAGLVAGVGLGLLALAPDAAPHVAGKLEGEPLGRVLMAGGGLSLVGAVLALWARRYVTARILAGALVTLVLAGWGYGMQPWLVAGSLTIQDTAAPAVTLRLVAWILAAGAVLLIPAFAYLYYIFKRQVLFPGR